MKTRIIIVSLVIIIILITILFTYFFLISKKGDKVNNIKTEQLVQCLNENERADFKIERLGEYPSDDYDRGFIEVVVKNIKTGQEISKFKIDNIINPSHYHPVESHRCSIYVIRVFNYDSSKTKQSPGYKEELWRYDYDGKKEIIILLAEKPKEFISYYSPDFRIDPNEKYIVLEKGYLGKDDYSLVIKDIKTNEDIFVLSSKSIFEQYPNIIGDFDMLEWSKDGRYFWGNVGEGAYVNGFFRVDTQNWKADIFEAPQDVLGGDALNVENGLITVHPGNEWYGFADMTEEEKKKRRAQGIGTELYIYNLITKKRQFVAKTDEPLYYFKPKWLSDTELQYELPTGGKKLYNVK